MKNNEVLEVVEQPKSVFDVLNSINVNGKTEKKNGLTYLSWAWAWTEVKKHYPNATYTIYERETEYGAVNYFTDGRTCWVKTGVTIEGLEHIEQLPVMNFNNKSINLDAITSFDVNKTIQRSLTKAVARHGLGLYIYAGEDLPSDEQEQSQEQPKEKPSFDTKKATAKQVEMINKLYEGKEDKLPKLLEMYKVASVEEFTMAQASDIISKLTKKKEG